jgi:putative tryptophan/tyrosine transport system substrate-binding protein
MPLLSPVQPRFLATTIALGWLMPIAGPRMRRREFIAGLGAAAWPVVARAQQRSVPVIGFLHNSTLTDFRRPQVQAFQRGLAETGFIEGRSLEIEYRWAEDRDDRLPVLAADLVRRQVAVIATGSSLAAAQAAERATAGIIPVVFLIPSDPVQYGLVASLARPGGNITGFTASTTEVIGKRTALLSELVPNVASFAFLFNPTNFNGETEQVQKAARFLGVTLLMLEAPRRSDIEPAFEKMVRQRAGALLVSSDPLFYANNDQVVALAARDAIPAIFTTREAVRAGGLVGYGSDIPDQYRQVGIYVGRILKGEKPADLPVQQPIKYTLAINLRTAKALGLAVPETLLATADEVIE